MKKLVPIAAIVCLLVTAGCSGGKDNPTGDNSVNQKGSKKHSQNQKPQKLEKKKTIEEMVETAPAPTSFGVIEGNVILTNTDKRAGNIFLYILDEDKMPDEVIIVAHTLVGAGVINDSRVPYTLEKVPEGEWTVMAVWDVDPPFCIVSEPYCELSARDSIGLSNEIATVTDGEVTIGVNISVF